MTSFLSMADRNHIPSASPRRLPWREARRQTAARPTRRWAAGLLLCAIVGVLASIPALSLHATSFEGPSLGDLLGDLRSAESMSVDINVIARFFPTATDTSEPT